MSSWGLRQENILDYKSVCYIAERLEPTEDEYGNLVTNFGEPKKYYFNIQPVTNTSEATAFGELAPKLKCAVISKSQYQNKFHEFDAVYLDDIKPIGESFNGEKANYRIYSVQPQNAIIKLYFIKVIKEGEVV